MRLHKSFPILAAALMTLLLAACEKNAPGASLDLAVALALETTLRAAWPNSTTGLAIPFILRRIALSLHRKDVQS